MRQVALIAVAIVMYAGPAFSQVGLGLSWSEYVSRDDYFSVNFPGQPKVESIVWDTEYRIQVPGRIYSYEVGGSRYSVTVVDYSDAIKIHLARNAECLAKGGDGDQCQDDSQEEMRGILVWASWNFMRREGVKTTQYHAYNSDRVEGHELTLDNPDGTRTFAAVHVHENRLYIIDATAPRAAPAPALFRVSFRFLDREFRPVRYEWDGIMLYSNGYPAPPRAGQGRQGGAGRQGGQGQGGQGGGGQ